MSKPAQMPLYNEGNTSVEKKLKQFRINMVLHPEIICYLEIPQTHTFHWQVICIVTKDENHKKINAIKCWQHYIQSWKFRKSLNM